MADAYGEVRAMASLVQGKCTSEDEALSRLHDDWESAVWRERRGPALWLTMDRQETLNGLAPDLMVGLYRGLVAARHDPEVRVVVLTGAGRAFCAGGNMNFQKELMADEEGVTEGWRTWLEVSALIMEMMRTLPKPVLGAVNGVAVAGGLELICNCDLVVAAENARIGDAHANYGILPGTGAATIFPRLVGTVRAAHLMMTGELYTARELEHWGFLGAVVPDDRLIEEAERIAMSIGAKSAPGIARLKRMLWHADDTQLETAIERERDQLILQGLSRDMQEGLAAFAERRKPDFRDPPPS